MADQYTVEDLGKAFKQKHPGVYDKLTDSELGKAVKAKPANKGKYDQFVDAPPVQTFGERNKEFFSQQGKEIKQFVGGIPREIGREGASVGGLVWDSLGGKDSSSSQSWHDAEKKMEPRNMPEKAASEAVQVGEYMLPVGEAAKGSGLLVRAGKAALKGGVLESIQTGDLKKGARQAVISGAVPVIGDAASKLIAPELKHYAKRIYENFIAPGSTTANREVNKMTTDEAADKLIEQGRVALTKQRFRKQIDSEYAETGAAVKAVKDKAINSQVPLKAADPNFPGGMVPPGEVEMGPIIDNMKEAIKKRFRRSGSIPAGDQPELNKWQEVLEDLLNRDNNGTADLKKIFSLREDWDSRVGESHQRSVEDQAAWDRARAAGANAIRKHLNSWVPGLKEVNEPYHFVAGLKRVLDNKELQQTGQSKYGQAIRGGAKVAGTLAGEHAGGAEGAVAGYAAMAALEHIVDGGAFKTLSSIGWDRLAGAMESKNFPELLKLLAAGVRQRPGSGKAPPATKPKEPPASKNTSSAAPAGVDFIYDPQKQSFAKAG